MRFVNIFRDFFNYLPGGRKEPRGTARRDGGIVKSDNLHKTIPQSASLTAPFTQDEPFLCSPIACQFP